MQLKHFVLMSFFLLLSGVTHSGTPSPTDFRHTITKKDLQKHVNFLSSDKLEGRLTGTIGEKIATQYVANVFHDLGLIPAGDNGTFFQEFNFTAGISLGSHNSLTITNQKGMTKQLVLNQEWRPLSFSDNTDFDNKELVFVGYGITAPALGKLPAYDSYHGINVKNKWVVVFRYTPERISPERSRQLSQYSSLRYKAFTAKEQGAKGIIFVSGPNSKVKHELIPLSFDTSLAGSGIIAISVIDNIIDDLLNPSSDSLQTLQDSLDEGKTRALPTLSHIKIVGRTDIVQDKQHGRNVLAKLKVSATHSPMIIVGAHVDHLGRGKLSGSMAREDEIGKIHSGADDNASGVASILEAARKLCNLKKRGKLHGDKDILFAAWSGEEFGILGSSHFVKNTLNNMHNQSLHDIIAADINLDMVGHLRKSLVLQGVGSSSLWPKLIEYANAKHTLSLLTQNDPYLPTDSTAFYLQGVPTLNFFTGAHEAYHTPRDKADTLNYEGIKNISEWLVNFILTLEDVPNVIDYQAVKKSDEASGRGFRVYLGTIPDYASADRVGVKISGVTKDSPAEQAGLRPDDVIIQLAGKQIHDIYDYSFVLRALHVGEPVRIVVYRLHKQVALTIVARSRE
ncbi:MAG: M28 family peptidase [Gammaproteobacteria bacterium]|nr:M28 family peptidase [Gammaproteobacteria bacterium]